MESMQKQLSAMVAKSVSYQKCDVNNRKSVTVQRRSDAGNHGTKSRVEILCFHDTF
jgi:hypothetical protein